jgi:hypothetical protein
MIGDDEDGCDFARRVVITVNGFAPAGIPQGLFSREKLLRFSA